MRKEDGSNKQQWKVHMNQQYCIPFAVLAQIKIKTCNISGFCHNTNEVSTLLGSYTA